jgi:hypothetical protein
MTTVTIDEKNLNDFCGWNQAAKEAQEAEDARVDALNDIAEDDLLDADDECDCDCELCIEVEVEVEEAEELDELLGEPESLTVDLVTPAYFGSYVVVDEDPDEDEPAEIHDMMLSAADSEDAAYGDIYRSLVEEFPFADGWRIKSIVVHPYRVGLYERALD